ncbi:Ferric siderophore transport system, periplasmic binding protein TonB [Methylophaga frappieri]|uniref:Ferric siderophore transport system, periplasmic binding protein TonB n=1 Tax=Methylophaga frappieri (strain ATCC BAA-2434 / DSM 25690 / JAM7) TaxID=754477 RepID=I1YK81_METFJ|nr:energy transducer TonB [Methylophaga frappieri]AFJ03324.1 Ferric siderophore transport system, periplasmic binding protein TonB [Methylophaga frappieri]
MAQADNNDCLIWMLLLSVLLHVIIVLNVSFNVFSPPTNAPENTLDITLVKQQTLDQPEQADFLAQANNLGGGIQEKPEPEPEPLPLVPVDRPLPEPEPEASPPAVLEQVSDSPIPEAPTPIEPAAEPAPEPEPVVEPKPVVTPPAETPTVASEKITTDSASEQVESVDAASAAHDNAVPESVPPRPSAQELIARAKTNIDDLQNQLAKNSNVLSNKPKKRRISAATKEFTAAAYMRAWERKVERLGNMNYPQAARDQNINGSLMLSVDIRPDGSVPADGIVVSRSSGHQVLDEAAIKIVRMGAPYANIPDDVLKGNDMLTIIRTWKFETQRGLSAR